MIKKLKYILFVLLLIAQTGYAQNYPVKATLQLTPPYSGYLLDYTDESNEKLKVLLTLNDVNVSNYNIKLLFSIEGNGYSIKTKQTFLAAPITLQGGVPELLGAYELNPYFATQNLLFAGLNTSIYQQNKSLPEGYYTISVTAYDYSSAEPKQVSNTATSSAWFTLSDPPQPISPNCGEQINLATTPQVVFQWLNQSISPYGQNNTEYVLELFEVRPDTKNPNDAIQSSYPVFSTTVEQPIFIYGPAEIPLIEGMLYAWRVKAKDKNGRLAYKNNGHSTVCTFRYGSKYAALESQTQLTLSVNVQTHRMVVATWDSIADYTNYVLQYKKASGNYNWREVKLSQAHKKIADLEPNTAYQAKVKGQVEDYTSPESNTVTFTTLPAQSFTCNSANTTLNPAELNVPLLQQATQDMIFTVGLFEMQVTQITGNNGLFSGKGIMFKGVFKLPVLVQFNNITVNQNQVVVAGDVYAITSPKSRMVVDLDVAWENIQQLLNELNNSLSNEDTSTSFRLMDSLVSSLKQLNLPDSVINSIVQENAAGQDCMVECKKNGSGFLPFSTGGKGSFELPQPSSDSECFEECPANFIAQINASKLKNSEDKYEKAIKDGKYVYSCNCGWIDKTHAFKNTSRNEIGIGVESLLNQLYLESGKKSKNGDGFYVIYTQDAALFGNIVGTTKEYFVKNNLSVEEREGIALAILQEVSFEFENLQRFGVIVLKGESSFEPADLISNLISFYRVVKHSTLYETAVLSLCGELDITKSLLVYKKYPGTFSKEEYKNHIFYPRFFVNSFCSINPKFPSELQTIKPAIKSHKFRDWKNDIDE